MNRRAFLVTAGVAATAGCLGFGSSQSPSTRTATDSGTRTATTGATASTGPTATAAETATATTTPTATPSDSTADQTTTDDSTATDGTAPLVNELIGGDSKEDAFETVVPFGDGEYICAGALDGPKRRDGWAASVTADGQRTGGRTYEAGRGGEIEHGIQLSDGYLFLGNVSPKDRSSVVGWAVRTDRVGRQQWTWRHEPSGASVAKGAARLDEGFLVAGTTIGGGQTAWVATLGPDGTLRSKRSFTETQSILNGLLETEAGPVGIGARDADGLRPWLIGLDAASETRWSRTYAIDGGYFDAATVTADGYVLSGETDVTENSGNALTVGTNADGALRWRDTVGNEQTETLLFGAETLSGGDVAVVGGTLDPDAGSAVGTVLRYDDAGERRFQRTYGNGSLSFLSDVIQRPDGALFCTGLGNYGPETGDAWVLVVPSV